MENLNNFLPLFLELLKGHTSGNQIQFSLDFQKNEIHLHDANAGFLRKLYLNTKFCTHLHNKVIKVTYFK